MTALPLVPSNIAPAAAQPRSDPQLIAAHAGRLTGKWNVQATNFAQPTQVVVVRDDFAPPAAIVQHPRQAGTHDLQSYSAAHCAECSVCFTAMRYAERAHAIGATLVCAAAPAPAPAVGAHEAFTVNMSIPAHLRHLFLFEGATETVSTSASATSASASATGTVFTPERVGVAEPTEIVVGLRDASRPWVFVPSRERADTGYLNHNHMMSANRLERRAIVVKPNQFNAYFQHWGAHVVIIALPTDDGAISTARHCIVRIANALGLARCWQLDDSALSMKTQTSHRVVARTSYDVAFGFAEAAATFLEAENRKWGLFGFHTLAMNVGNATNQFLQSPVTICVLQNVAACLARNYLNRQATELLDTVQEDIGLAIRFVVW